MKSKFRRPELAQGNAETRQRRSRSLSQASLRSSGKKCCCSKNLESIEDDLAHLGCKIQKQKQEREANGEDCCDCDGNDPYHDTEEHSESSHGSGSESGFSNKINCADQADSDSDSDRESISGYNIDCKKQEEHLSKVKVELENAEEKAEELEAEKERLENELKLQ